MKQENKIISKEVSNASLYLAAALQEMMDSTIVNYSNGMEDVPGNIIQLSNKIEDISRKQQQSLNSFDTVKQLIENTVSANELLENAGQTNLLLGKEHYEVHIIEPMLRSLLPVVDIIEDSRKHNNFCHCSSTKVLDSIYSQVLQFLAGYGVEMFKHQPGDKFDPKNMKPIKWEFTSDASLNNTVAKSLQAGFRFEQTRILRMETVSLFKYKLSETENNNFNERIEI